MVGVIAAVGVWIWTEILRGFDVSDDPRVQRDEPGEAASTAGSRLVFVRAARLLVMGAAVWGIQGLLGAYELAALLLGILAVQLAMGRDCPGWDALSRHGGAHAARNLALGFVLGAAAVLAVVAVGALAGLVSVRVGHPGLVGLGMGLVVAILTAARSELLFRAAPLGLAKGLAREQHVLVFTVLLTIASTLWQATFVGVVMSAALAWVLALAWHLGKGMGLALGLHAGTLFMLGPGIRGSLLDVSLGQGQLLPMQHGVGAIGWVAVGVFTALGMALAGLSVRGRRGEPRPQAPVSTDAVKD